MVGSIKALFNLPKLLRHIEAQIRRFSSFDVT